MLDIRLLRENRKLVEDALAKRGMSMSLKVFYDKDNKRLELLKRAEELKHKRNIISKDIGAKKSKSEDTAPLLEEVKGIGAEINTIQAALDGLETELNEFLMTVPNMPHSSVVYGKTSDDNPVVKTWGAKKEISFTPYTHDELAAGLGIIDFDRGVKVASSGFSVSIGHGALLERALINFFLDVHTKEQGYTELYVPYVVNGVSMTGTGQLPKFKQDLFKIEGEELYLIPTSEVPITNVHAKEILEKATLPLCYTAYSPCFRKEAGSYGKDTKGLIRQHQFNKVELVKFVEPEASYGELESLLLDAEEPLKRLGLHYRVVSLCSGDLGFSAAKTYDIEVWLPGQNEYREISSCSNFEDFQARRAGIKYRPAKGEKPAYVHTLNGSGLAIGRTVVAILENYQQEDQSVVIPEVLRPYMNGVTVLRPAKK
ncbi:MAG: serine--tRNA ligase [Deltaproteobacteria bacterium]|nr:serine--tRNA ligase [Deltaproteobacteria bacterium]MCL5277927.1 serine--tRNA ligase [Deltaproteobacteria bacterium]